MDEGPRFDFRLVDLAPAHFKAVAALAARIWREHYTPIIGEAQVEYMLRSRYTPELLRAYLGSRERWFEVLFVGDAMTGYVSYALDGQGGMKLEQLYVEEKARGQRLGRAMIDHVEAAARSHGCHRVWLTANRSNVRAIGLYERRGYGVEREAVFDIGSGFVMDDYVMQKEI